MKPYHYTECGLNNVYIRGVTIDDDGTVGIPNIIHLHVSIARAVVGKTARLNGDEIRFLRSELGMTQNNLADHLGVQIKTVQRWEKGEVIIGKAEDILIRVTATEGLNLDKDSIWSMATKATEKYETTECHTIDMTGAVA